MIEKQSNDPVVQEDRTVPGVVSLAFDGYSRSHDAHVHLADHVVALIVRDGAR